jgi:hypothetical protein
MCHKARRSYEITVLRYIYCVLELQIEREGTEKRS